ncbi:uncharacterized protein LOC144447389 [Glandiceps talaboti]
MNNTVSCNYGDGKCNCKPGWIGKTCNNMCNQGMHGQDCTKKCTCMMNNTISCDHDDGTCNCKPGWMGLTCNQTCSSHTYGQHCNQNCTCNEHNTESCYSTNGTCYCKSGWTGSHCYRACSSGWYGDGCQARCNCMSNTTVSCDKFNGTCFCQPGWTGMYCNETIRGYKPLPESIIGVRVTEISVGTTVGLLAVIFTVSMIITMLRKYRNTKKSGEQTTSHNNPVYEDIITGTSGEANMQEMTPYAECVIGDVAHQPGNINEGNQYAALQRVGDNIYTGLTQIQETNPYAICVIGDIPHQRGNNNEDNQYASLQHVDDKIYTALTQKIDDGNTSK